MKDLPSLFFFFFFFFELLSFIEHVPVNLKITAIDSLSYIAKNDFDTTLQNSKLFCKIFKFVPEY